jgi:chromosome segregation ATPase
LDPLTKVKEAINTLISELLDEKEVETKKRDSCVQMIHDNELQTEAFTRDKEGLESQEASLKAEISEVEEAMKTLTAEIAELHVQIKRAGEDREAENKDFQATILDQQETQKLLQKALQILKAVYKQPTVVSEAAALAQQAPGGGEDQPAPPPGFREYGQNRAGGGVVAMIEQIISDAHHMEEMATKDEQTAQQQYETFVKDTNTAVQDKQTGLVNKGEAQAKAKGKLLEVEGSISETHGELETLSNTLTTLKQDCDFLLRNFDIRQEARDEEVEALREALAVLSGMKLE